MLVAALFKLSAGDAGALGQNAILFSPAVQMLSVVAELLLGGWLVSGQRRVECWAATLLFFALMAGVSLWLAA